jgi:hypothetical protein
VVSGCATGELLCDGACADCPPTANGNPVCDGSECDLVCHANAHRCGNTCRANDDVNACGDECVRCPDGPDTSPRCIAGQCVAVCDAGLHKCGDACVPNNSVATCGDRCTPCPGTEGGVATCSSGSCSFNCDAGRVLCGGRCLDCGPFGACGSDGACQRLGCPSGEVLCQTGCCPAELTVPALSAAAAFNHQGSGGVSMARTSQGKRVIATVSPKLMMVRRERARSWEDTLVQAAGDYQVSPVILMLQPDETALVVTAVARQLTLFRVPVTGPWTSEPIGPIADVPNSDYGAALGSDGTLHIARRQTIGGVSQLRYSKLPPGGAWSHEVVTDTAHQSVDIALDAAGTPHVVWVNTDHVGWSLAIRRDGWTAERRSTVRAYAVRVAVDSSGNPHVAYSSRQSSDVTACRWARKSDAGWTDEWAAECSFLRAIGVHGTTPHVVMTTTQDVLLHAKRDGASWTRTHHMFADGASSGAAITLDAQGVPSFAFSHDELEFFQQGSSAKTLDKFRTTTGFDAQLAVGPDGSLHAVFEQGLYKATVVYVHVEGDRARHWVLGDDHVRDLDLALDPQGRPTVVWFSDGSVKARRFDGQDWTVAETRAVGVQNATVAVTVDRLGVGHFIYRSSTHLHYCTIGLDGKLGPFSLVESMVTPSYADIVMGPAGPMAVYRKSGSVPSLRFAARRQDGTWHLEDVDDGLALGNAVGADAVLLVDAEGTPHVLYRDENALDVKFARRIGAGANAWTRTYIATEGSAGVGLAAARAADGTLHTVFGDNVRAFYLTWQGGAWTAATLGGVVDQRGSAGAMVVDVNGRVIISRSADFSLVDF